MPSDEDMIKARLEELMKAHWDGIFRMLIRMLNGHYHNACELASATFVTATENLLTEGNQSPLWTDRAGAWLYQTSKYKVYNLRRTKSANPPLNIDQITPPTTVDDYPSHAGDTLQRAWSKLNEAEREILSLRHLEDHDTETIAGMLGITPGAVRGRISRAVKHLKKIIADIDNEPRE